MAQQSTVQRGEHNACRELINGAGKGPAKSTKEAQQKGLQRAKQRHNIEASKELIKEAPKELNR